MVVSGFVSGGWSALSWLFGGCSGALCSAKMSLLLEVLFLGESSVLMLAGESILMLRRVFDETSDVISSKNQKQPSVE